MKNFESSNNHEMNTSDRIFIRESAFRLAFLSIVVVLFFSGGCSINSLYTSDKLSLPNVGKVSESEIVQSVFLIGDAGEQEVDIREPVLVTLETEASKNPARNAIVFLGDNVYPNGMPEQSDPQRPVAELRLTEQIRVIENSKARGIFIPGNHDWGTGRSDSGVKLQREHEFITSKNNPQLEFSPAGGLPGPDILDIGEKIRIVTIDTEWWLQSNPKPLYSGSSGEGETKTAFLDSLSNAITSAGKRYVIVVGHHPLDSHGIHSGFFDWKSHLFPLRNLASWLWLPLPGIGSLYPFLRNHGLSNQDFSGAAYQDLRKALSGIFAKASPFVYASGHEHVLEILKSPGTHLNLVSGFGTSEHDPALTTGESTIFADRHTGFMRIDILSDGRGRLAVLEPSDEQGTPSEVYSMWITKEGTQP